LEQQGVERYLDSQFYENVNSLAWRDHLRASQGFCHEHAWLAVHKRLGDPLGFSIVYHDVINNLLKSLPDNTRSTSASERRASVPGQGSASLRNRIEALLNSLVPQKRCPACEYRDELTHSIFAGLVADLPRSELTDALQASDGLCLPHLRRALGSVKSELEYESLLTIHRAKLENLKNELAEFIRKNDYRVIKEGFGSEGDAWLRSISLMIGSRKER
jgi:hypothetical protein